jgi:hypothetical protein
LLERLQLRLKLLPVLRQLAAVMEGPFVLAALLAALLGRRGRLPAALHRPLAQDSGTFGQRQVAAGGWQTFEVLISGEAAEGADLIARAHLFQHAIDGRGRRGQQQDSFAAPGGLAYDLGDDARLAGSGQTGEQADVGRLQCFGDRLTLGFVQGGVDRVERRRHDRLEIDGFAGEQTGKDLMRSCWV